MGEWETGGDGEEEGVLFNEKKKKVKVIIMLRGVF